MKAGRKEWFQEHRLRGLVKGHSFSETSKKKSHLRSRNEKSLWHSSWWYFRLFFPQYICDLGVENRTASFQTIIISMSTIFLRLFFI